MLMTMAAIPREHGPPMNTSFAQIRSLLQVGFAALLLPLAACASLPPPTTELAAAQQSVTRAGNADADQYAAAELAQARNALEQAQATMARGRDEDARSLALLAAAAADLAYARSRAAAATTELAQRRAEIAELKQRLHMEEPL